MFVCVRVSCFVFSLPMQWEPSPNAVCVVIHAGLQLPALLSGAPVPGPQRPSLTLHFQLHQSPALLAKVFCKSWDVPPPRFTKCFAVLTLQSWLLCIPCKALCKAQP